MAGHFTRKQRFMLGTAFAGVCTFLGSTPAFADCLPDVPGTTVVCNTTDPDGFQTTTNSVTIRDGSSQQHVILRSEAVSISASTYSLMPNELERTMSEQDLADLIGYLKAR